MVDTQIDSDAFSLTYNSTGNPTEITPVWVSETVCYVFYRDSGNDMRWNKFDTTVWDGPTELSTASSQYVSVWYEKFTSEGGGGFIHIAWLNRGGTDAVMYAKFDTSDDTFDIARKNIATGMTVPENSYNNASCTIIVTRGGTNVAIGWVTATTEHGTELSTDGGTTFNTVDDWSDASTIDQVLFMPGAETDPDDFLAFIWDSSANAIVIKTYDDDLDTWSAATTLASSMIQENNSIQWAASHRHSDNHTLFAAWDDYDPDPASLLVWDVTDRTTSTALNNVITDGDECGNVSLFIDQQANDLYACYCIGTEIRQTVDVVYKKLTNMTGSWGTQTDLTENTPDDIRLCGSGMSVGNDGGKFRPIWINTDLGELFWNLTTGFDIPEATTPVTKTFTIGATLQKVITKTAAIAATLQKVITKTGTVGATLQKVITKDTAIAATLQKVITKDTVAGATLQKVITATTAIAATLQKVITKDTVIAATLEKVVTKTFLIGATLDPASGAVTKTFTIGATLQKIITQTTDIAATLQKVITKDTAIAATLQKVVTTTAAIAATLQKVITKTATVGATLQKVITKDTAIAATLQKVVTKTFAIAASLATGQTKTFAIAATLQKVVTKDVTGGATLHKDLILKTGTIGATLAIIADFDSTTIDSVIFDRGADSQTFNRGADSVII